MLPQASSRRPWIGRRLLIRLALSPFALVLLYIAAGIGLGSLRLGKPAEFSDPGIRIFILSNGYHASLILPLRTVDADWTQWFPAGDFASPPEGATHVMFGWGERDFYMNTRTLADLEVPTALRALSGLGGAVMHVAMIGEPTPGPRVRALTISPEAHRSLVTYVGNGFKRGAHGAVTLHPGKGYGPYDAFYEATGSYSLFTTCNEWVAGALRVAGIPTGLWTPFPISLVEGW